ncbi:MAG: glycogen-binding domain-containing protein [Planctomycetota bacterium]
MYDTLKNGRTQFIARPAGGVTKVEVAGAHTNWMPVAMKRRADGTYQATVKLPPGAHEYKFVVDGAWHTDPDNKLVVPNPFGTVNSLAMIPRQNVTA